VVLALVLCAALLFIGFALAQPWGMRPLVLVFLLLGSAVAAAWADRKAPRGQLSWDGAQWHWSSQDKHLVTSLACILDLQQWVLLRIGCERGPNLWLWLEAGDNHTRWVALRRAVVSSRRAAGHEAANDAAG
jgi:hypothetical protein